MHAIQWSPKEWIKTISQVEKGKRSPNEEEIAPTKSWHQKKLQ